MEINLQKTSDTREDLSYLIKLFAFPYSGEVADNTKLVILQYTLHQLAALVLP